MKFLITLISIIVVTSCGVRNDFPLEFSGHWELVSNEHTKAITVTDEGVWTFDDLPSQVQLKLRVLERRDDEYVFETMNILNPGPKQYTLNRIENGIWIVTALHEDLSIVDGVTDDRWKPIER